MSVIVRLQNLPWTANAGDIRQYFDGLSIPDGGVHIVGGELGDAFIAFSTDEDARLAMLRDSGKLKDSKIRLFLSSRAEMQKIIDAARQQTLQMHYMQMQQSMQSVQNMQTVQAMQTVQSMQNLPNLTPGQNLQNLPNMTPAQNMHSLSNMTSSQNMQSLPNMTPSQNMQSLPNMTSTQNIQNLPNMTSSQNMQSLPNMSSSQNMQSLPNMSSSQNMQSLPNITSSQNMQSLPNITSSQNMQSLPNMSSSQNMQSLPNMSSSQNMHTIPNMAATNVGVHANSMQMPVQGQTVHGPVPGMANLPGLAMQNLHMQHNMYGHLMSKTVPENQMSPVHPSINSGIGMMTHQSQSLQQNAPALPPQMPSTPLQTPPVPPVTTIASSALPSNPVSQTSSLPVSSSKAMPAAISTPAVQSPNNQVSNTVLPECATQSSTELENKTEASSREKKDRRSHRRSRSHSRDLSRERSRSRSHSRDRRSRDRHYEKDRRRRRSRSRDHRRSRRDRSRSRDRPSRDRRRDYDRNAGRAGDDDENSQYSFSSGNRWNKKSDQRYRSSFHKVYTNYPNQRNSDNNYEDMKASTNSYDIKPSQTTTTTTLTPTTSNRTDTDALKSAVTPSTTTTISSATNTAAVSSMKAPTFFSNISLPDNKNDPKFFGDISFPLPDKKPEVSSHNLDIKLPAATSASTNPSKLSGTQQNTNEKPYNHIKELEMKNKESSTDIKGNLPSKPLKEDPLIFTSLDQSGSKNITLETSVKEEKQFDWNSKSTNKGDHKMDSEPVYPEPYPVDNWVTVGENFQKKVPFACVHVKNIPPFTRYPDIKSFFRNVYLPVGSIKMLSDEKGGNINSAYVRFASISDKKQAMLRNGCSLNNSIAYVVSIDDKTFEEAEDFANVDPKQYWKKRNMETNAQQKEQFTKLQDAQNYNCLQLEGDYKINPIYDSKYSYHEKIRLVFNQVKPVDTFVRKGDDNIWRAFVKFENASRAKDAHDLLKGLMVDGKMIKILTSTDQQFAKIKEEKVDSSNVNSSPFTAIQPIVSSRNEEIKSTFIPDPQYSTAPIYVPNMNHMNIGQQNIMPHNVPPPYFPPMFPPPMPRMNSNPPMMMMNNNMLRMNNDPRMNAPRLNIDPRMNNNQRINSEPRMNNDPRTQNDGRMNTDPRMNNNHQQRLNSNQQEMEQKEREPPRTTQPAPRVLLPTPPMEPKLNYHEEEITLKTNCIMIKGLPLKANDKDILDFFRDVDIVPTQIHIMLDSNRMPVGDAYCEFNSTDEAASAAKKNNCQMSSKFIHVRLVSRDDLQKALGYETTTESTIHQPFYDGPRGGNSMEVDPPFSHPNMMRGDRNNMRGDQFSGRNSDHQRSQQMPDNRQFGFNRGGDEYNYGAGTRGGFNNRDGRGFPVGRGGRGSAFSSRGASGRGHEFGGPSRGRGGPSFGGRGMDNRAGVSGGDRKPLPMMAPPSNQHAMNNDRPEEFDDIHSQLLDNKSVEEFGKPGCVVAAENIPYRASITEILDFFGEFKLIPDNIIRRYNDEGKITGDARIAFESPSEARRAVKYLNRSMFLNRRILLTYAR